MAKQTDPPVDEGPKNPVGRPLLFKSVEELDVAIQRYFDLCDPHVEKRIVDGGLNQKGETIWVHRGVLTEQKPYLMTGLARALGVDRKTLLNYKNRDEFFPSVAAALDRCEEYAEGNLFGPYSNGAKFALNNNYDDWVDKKAVDHTTQGKPILGGTTPLLDDEDDNQDDQPTDGAAADQ